MFNITITDLSGLHLHAGGAAGPLQVVYQENPSDRRNIQQLVENKEDPSL